MEGLNKKNNIQEIAENKKDINTYITKKSKIAGELSGAGSYIKGLIEERENLEKELEANSEYVKAPISGVVSYRGDKLDLKTGQIVATSNEKGKVINNYECYIVAVVKSKEAEEVKVREKSNFKTINSGRD